MNDHFDWLIAHFECIVCSQVGNNALFVNKKGLLSLTNFCAIGFFFEQSSKCHKSELNIDLLKQRQEYSYRKQWLD